jgi:tellurite methyltransferase
VFSQVLAPGGLLVFAQPTRSNLQRNPHPSARFLLEDGELPQLLRGLKVISYTEGWTEEGRHEARLVATPGP